MQSDTHKVVVKELRGYVERIERLTEEKQNTTLDIADLYKEAKGRGFDTKVLKRLIKERKCDPGQVAAENEILALYRDALNMPGFDEACKQAESSKKPKEKAADQQYKVISLAGKTVEFLAQVKKDGGTFKPLTKKDTTLAERFSDMGFLKEIKDKHIWKLTKQGEAQIPETLM